jgi:alpha-mannosidase
MLKFKNLCFATLTIGCSSCSVQTASAQLPTGEVAGFAWQVEPSYGHRTDGKPGRSINILLKDFFGNGPVSITATCNRSSETTVFRKSDTVSRFRLLLPPGAGADSAITAELTAASAGKTSSATVFVPRSKQWTVYIYPHSHLDIGYTAPPEEVKKLQLRNIDVGIDIASRTVGKAPASRFTWNPEAGWIVKGYLEQATGLQKQQFVAAVRKGWVNIDGGYANSDLSTMSDEQLIHFFQTASAIGKITGVPVSTMVQMDVPGAPWGLVTVAAQFGIKGFISFPNNFDLRKQWEHKPFYWLGPDGKTRILFLQGFPYGIGYTIKGSKYGLKKLQAFSSDYDRVSTPNPLGYFLNPFIFEETGKLEQAGSPYDIFAMTWSMADNCVIDADLPGAVEQWNNIYAYPKLVIANAAAILDAYEKKYAAIIPICKGDFTEFWTNGLGADAVSVGAGRKAKEELVQAEILSSILRDGQRHFINTNNAWEDQLLSAEHTWGAQQSGSALARQIEQTKSGYFKDAAIKRDSLVIACTAPFTDSAANGFCVINTLSWNRTGIVVLSPQQSRFGDGIVDENNHQVASQRLSTGELIFAAPQIPALGSKWFKEIPVKYTRENRLTVTGNELRNDFLSVRVDPVTGNIIHVQDLKNGYEYVDSSTGANSYYYLPSVYNGKASPGSAVSAANVAIRVKEQGPLMVSLLISAEAEGVSNFTREVKLYQGSPTVEIVNTFNKIATRKKEGIHFGFGFHLPASLRRMDMPWSIVSPNVDQLEGSNKNWFAFQRWVDISNKEHGVTWTAIESPLIEWGTRSGNILDGARLSWLWQKRVPESSVLYSWVLNNHWDTNFPLEQGGIMQQHYSFMVHDAYDVVKANRFGMEAFRPLLPVQTKKNLVDRPLLQIDNPNLVISTMQRNAKGVLLRVRSVSGKTEELSLEWPSGITECSATGDPGDEIKNTIEVAPYGMKTLQLNFR